MCVCVRARARVHEYRCVHAYRCVRAYAYVLYTANCFVIVKVRRLQTGRGTATIQIRSVCEEDIYKAVEDFKLCERLANTKRDLTLMDHMGKKLYALRKIEGNLPSVAKTYNI